MFLQISDVNTGAKAPLWHKTLLAQLLQHQWSVHQCVHVLTYVHTYIRTCTQTYISAYVRMYIRRYVHTQLHTIPFSYILIFKYNTLLAPIFFLLLFLCTYVRTYECVLIFVHSVHICTYMYVFIYVHTYVCICTQLQ